MSDLKTVALFADHVTGICQQVIRSLGGPVMPNGVDLNHFVYQLSAYHPAQIVEVEMDLWKDLKKCLN